MTIRGLIRKLEAAEKKIGPRAQVTVDLREVPCCGDDGELVYSALNCFNIVTATWSVDDSIHLESGEERMRTFVVLS